MLPKLCVGIPDSKIHGANMGPIWGRQINYKDDVHYTAVAFGEFL